MTESQSSDSQKGGLTRWSLLALGVGLTVLATIGAFLPVLPTTPFLILAAACFARSSPSCHRYLLQNRVFGPYLQQWDHDHTVPPEAKRKAYGLVLISLTISITAVDSTWIRGPLALLGIALLGYLAWLPTTPEREETPRGGENPQAALAGCVDATTRADEEPQADSHSAND